MKRLFTTTALVASMAFASVAYAAGIGAGDGTNTNTPTDVTPAQQGAQQNPIDAPAGTAEDITTGSLKAETSDVIAMRGDNAMMSETAISARNVIGAPVIGPNGDEIGTVNDLVLDEENAIERIVITDGGILGYGGKEVAIDFEGASITRGENQDRTVRIGMTSKALENAAEFDKAPLEQSGDRLASSWLDRDVMLATKEDGQAALHDLIMDANGTAKYAVIAFGGLLDMGDTEVAVKLGELTPASADEPLSLAMTQDQLRLAPRFHYPDDKGDVDTM